MSALLRRLGQVPASLALGLASLLVITASGAAVALGGSAHRLVITAHFSRAVGLYEQSTVRVLGVPVGTITKIVPEGTSVAVTMEITKEGVKVPADAQAFIIPPALVSDRYVQLVPAYTSGPALAEGDDIPLERTHAPVEKDQLVASLDRLDQALGPDGANRDGALSALVHVGAQNLTPSRAQQIRQTVGDLADLVVSLDQSKDSLSGAVTQLDRFTELLLRDDAQIRTLYTDLVTVSAQLDGDRTALAAALKNLSLATGEIASLVKDSRGDLKANLAGITDLTKVLVQNKDSIIETLDTTPLGLKNLSGAFNPASDNLETRANEDQLLGSQSGVVACQLFSSFGLPCLTTAAGQAQAQALAGAATAGTGRLR